MLNTALAYLRYGWSVFPLRPKTKVAAFSWDKFQRERASETLLATWWNNNPNFNIGVATGVISGVVVVDCDSPEAVERYLAHPDYKPTLNVATGDGMHFYHQTANFPIRNFGRILPDVDIRGDGGYVVAPPSIHPTGRRYQWHECIPIQPLPDYILELVKPKEEKRSASRPNTLPAQSAVRGTRYAQSVFDREYGNVISASEGLRNNQLNRSAYNLGQLVGDGLLNRFDVEQALLQGALSVGLSEREALATIASGLKAGVGNPRSLRGR